MNSYEIQRLRQDAGLNLTQIGQLLGVAPATYMRWEQGTSIPSTLHIATLRQLRERVDALMRTNTPNEVITSRIVGFLVTGGIIAFLLWLFNREE
jgi:transcriptional regulator with XRE-family HTH domain